MRIFKKIEVIILDYQSTGTPAFMGPEQWNSGSPYDGKMADAYSVGATLFCLRVSEGCWSNLSVIVDISKHLT